MKTILVVDDSEIDRRLAQGLLLTSADLFVECAASAKAALAKLATRPAVHLVVTDLVMPELSGLDLLTILRLKYPRLPVILMTGHGSEETAMDALNAGACSYIPKSVLHRQLLSTVEAALAFAEKGGWHNWPPNLGK